MKKPHIYLISVLLTVLLIFSLLVTGCLMLLCFKGLDTDTALNIAQEKNLAERVHVSLTQRFTDLENATGIPLSVYENTITAENCDKMIQESIRNGFGYLNGRNADASFNPDFSVLETDMRAFLSAYADEHGVEKDAGYELAVKNAMTAAKQEIKDSCDVYRFGALYDAKALQKAQRILKWSGFLAVGSGLITLLIALFLFMTNHAEGRHGFYWGGIAVIIASVLLLVPAVWLTRTKWFDRFAVKTDQVFAAVTGYLYTMTHAAERMAIWGIAAGFVMIVLFVLLHIRSRRAAALRNTKH
ncbi:MAG: hypothetical protein IJ060_01190 [Oscillospiraceae bacterium]|nr:hypothetical protein [Oscillospiraceae bacterium]